jgi:hypothetical protein
MFLVLFEDCIGYVIINEPGKDMEGRDHSRFTDKYIQNVSLEETTWEI